MLLPEPSVALSKINTKPVTTPKEIQPDFVLDPEVELLLLERQKTWKQRSDTLQEAHILEQSKTIEEDESMESNTSQKQMKQKALGFLKKVETVNKDKRVKKLKGTNKNKKP